MRRRATVLEVVGLCIGILSCPVYAQQQGSSQSPPAEGATTNSQTAVVTMTAIVTANTTVREKPEAGAPGHRVVKDDVLQVFAHPLSGWYAVLESKPRRWEWVPASDVRIAPDSQYLVRDLTAPVFPRPQQPAPAPAPVPAPLPVTTPMATPTAPSQPVPVPASSGPVRTYTAIVTRATAIHREPNAASPGRPAQKDDVLQVYVEPIGDWYAVLDANPRRWEWIEAADVRVAPDSLYIAHGIGAPVGAATAAPIVTTTAVPTPTVPAVGGSYKVHGLVFRGVSVYSAQQIQDVVARQLQGLINAETLHSEAVPATHAGAGMVTVSFAEATVPGAALQSTAQALADMYHQAGYTLAVVNFPESADERYSDGLFTFVVLEPRLGNITVTGNKRYSTGFIKRYFRGFQDKPFSRQALEQSLLLLKDNPAMYVDAVLKPGEALGTADLDLTITETERTSYRLEFNNFGTRFASRERFSESLGLGNLSGHGDNLALQLVHAPSPSDLAFGRVSYDVPVDRHGTRLSAYALGGDFEVAQEFAILNIKGSGFSYGIAARRPLEVTRAKKTSLDFGFDANDAKQKLLGQTSSDDRIRSLHLGYNYDGIAGAGRNLVSVAVHEGLGSQLGGMADNDPMASRIGADDRFTKLSLEAAHLHQLSSHAYLIGRLSGQLASTSLVVGEQMSIGGADSVRGYPQSEFLGDSGYQASLEARITPTDKYPDWLNSLQFVLFLDRGTVTSKNPAAGQNKSDSLTGTGLGLRAVLSNHLGLRADFGYGLSGTPSSGGRIQPYFQIYYPATD